MPCEARWRGSSAAEPSASLASSTATWMDCAEIAARASATDLTGPIAVPPAFTISEASMTPIRTSSSMIRMDLPENGCVMKFLSLYSSQDVPGAGDQDAGAAGFAPHPVVAGPRRATVAIAGNELAFINPELAVEQMQLLGRRMGMRGIARVRRQAHQHADPVPLAIGCQQLAFDAGRHFLPCRLGPARPRRRHRCRWFCRYPLGDPRFQRRRRSQHIGRPGNEALDHRPQAFQQAPAVRT